MTKAAARRYNGRMEINAQLAARLSEAYGAEAENVIRGLCSRRKTTFRVNTLKSTAERVESALQNTGIAFERIGGGYAVAGGDYAALRSSEMYANGEIYVQSLSSMLPPLALGASAGENVLDMCAAPGGKTSQIAALTGGGAYITACEINPVRAERLKHNLALLGVRRVSVLVTDASALDPAMKFDRILLDAPCSGSGTLSETDGGNFSEKLLAACMKKQRALLSRAFALLAPGGVLVYSTCSLLPCENEEALLSALPRSGFSVAETGLAPERAAVLPSECGTLVAPDEYYEGFFVAKVVSDPR